MARAKQFGDPDGEINDEISLKFALAKKIKSVDINAVKNDVMPFLKEPRCTKIWSGDYFLELVRVINFSLS